MKNETTILSPAKINRYLHIKGIRDDRFHEIETKMQKISLADEITLTPKKAGISITSEGNITIPTNAENLAYQAAKALYNKRKTLSGVHIHIHKNIPTQAGLGGGSSNAGVVLREMNILWDIHLKETELFTIGATIGSDVPFFVSSSSEAVCSGTGSTCTFSSDTTTSEETILLIQPKNIKIPTAWAYSEWDKTEKNKTHDTNDLAPPVFARFPDLQSICDELITQGATEAQMTGSGSVIFGVFSSKKAAISAEKHLKKWGWTLTSQVLR